MKLCWDNIENVRLTKNSNFRDVVKRKTYLYKEYCKTCKEPFLYIKGDMGVFCSYDCSAKFNCSGEKNPMYGVHRYGKENPMYGKHHTEDTKKKIRDILKNDDIRKKISSTNSGKYRTEEAKRKMSKNRKGKGGLKGSNHPNWNGGYRKNNIPRYDTYAHQLEWAEKVRRSTDDSNVLEVKCTYCGKWFIPEVSMVRSRVQAMNGNINYKGEYHFYCSEFCKSACPIYHKTPEALMREDALRAGRLNWLELNREVQPELRQMVLKRDEYKCVKCGSTGPLHCHHIIPIFIEPLLSADIDNCMTLCEDCHKQVHKLPECGYNEIRMEVC